MPAVSEGARLGVADRSIGMADGAPNEVAHDVMRCMLRPALCAGSLGGASLYSWRGQARPTTPPPDDDPACSSTARARCGTTGTARDIVAAAIVLPAEPTIEDVEAAAKLAGRLGFETTALTLPVVLKASEIKQPSAIALPILVGRSNAFVKSLVDKGSLDVKELKPGQALGTIVALARRTRRIGIVGATTGDAQRCDGGVRAFAGSGRDRRRPRRPTRRPSATFTERPHTGRTGSGCSSTAIAAASLDHRARRRAPEGSRAAAIAGSPLHRRGLSRDINYTNVAATRTAVAGGRRQGAPSSSARV